MREIPEQMKRKGSQCELEKRISKEDEVNPGGTRSQDGEENKLTLTKRKFTAPGK